jgi:hypothetical protein
MREFCFGISREGVYMRANRKLAENVWYFVATKVNDREPMFWSKCLIWLFERVLSELSGIYAVEIRGLRFDGAAVSFYIRPADGLMLPFIMKWIKQTFAVRYNLLDERTGHLWGDRYFSEILEGEPPVWAEIYRFMEIARPVRKGDWRREAERIGFEPRCGKRRCCRTCHGRVGQTLAPSDSGKARVPAGFPPLS